MAIKSGDRFGRLVATVVEPKRRGRPFWLCRCDCGGSAVVGSSNLVTGSTRSCGCIKREVMAARNQTHGLTKRYCSTYRSWKDMRARCNNPNGSDYQNYGGRGVSVCKRWDDFAAFFADMGERPEGLTLDRIDTNGNYGPENCRWADRQTQAANQRRCTRITHNGQTKTVAEWARYFDVGRCTARYRLKIGMTFEEAFSQNDYRL